MAKAPLFEVKRDTATPFVAAAFVAVPQAPPERAIPSLLAAKLAENNAALGRAADPARAPAPAAEPDAPPPPEPAEAPLVALAFPASAAAAPAEAPKPPPTAAAPVDVPPVAPEPPAPAAAASEEWLPVAPEPAAPAAAAAAVSDPDPVPVAIPPLPAAAEADVPLPPHGASVPAAPPSPLAETGPDAVEATLFAALDLAAALDLPPPTPGAAAPDAPPAAPVPPLVEAAADFVPTPEPEPGNAAPDWPTPDPATAIAAPAAGTDATWIALYEESVAALAVRREDLPAPAHAAEAIGPSAALGLRDPQPGATPATARPHGDARSAKAPQPGLVTEITQVIESVLSSKSYWAQQAPGAGRAPERAASRPRGGRSPARGRGGAVPAPPPAASSAAASRQTPRRTEPGLLARAWRAVRVVVLAVVVTVLTGNLLSPGFWTGLLDRATPRASVSVPIPQAAPEAVPPRAHKPARPGRAAETR